MPLYVTIPALALLYLLYQVADAFGDVAIELQDQNAWHRWGVVTAGLFIAAVSFAAFGLSWYTLISCVALTVLRLPVFNILHNIAKGQRWYYVGTTSAIDKLIRRTLSCINFDKK